MAFLTMSIEASGNEFDLSGINFGQLIFKQTQGPGFGYKKAYTSLELFIVPRNIDADQFVPFIDLRGHRFSNNRWAANVGIGARRLMSSVDAVVGANVYYDYRDVRHSRFQQVGIGFEILQRHFEARLNVYLPTKLKSGFFDHRSFTICDPTFMNFAGNAAIISGKTTHRSKKYFTTLRGFDAEIGKNFNLGPYFKVYLAVGPYYYSQSRSHDFWGGSVRCCAQFMDFLSVDVRSTSDRVYHNKFSAQVSFTIPLGPGKNDGVYNDSQSVFSRLSQVVYRNEIIPVRKHTKRSANRQMIPVVDPLTGQPLHFIFVNNTNPNAGNGTFEDPFNTLMAAQNGSHPNDIIYVFEGDGTTNGMNEGMVLQNNQQFLGGGNSYTVTSICGPSTIPPQSGRPHITNLTGDAVALANNNFVAGFDIDAPMGAGIVGTGIAGTTIQDNIISEPMANLGISLTDCLGQLNIFDNTINTSLNDSGEGVSIMNHGTTSCATIIMNNHVTASFEGIEVFSFDTSSIASIIMGNTVQGTDTTFTGIDIDAFDASTQTTLVDSNAVSNIAGPGGIGIFVISSRRTLTPPVTFTFIKSMVTNNTVTGSNAFGIAVATGNGGQQCTHIEGNTAIGNGGPGIAVETSNTPGGDELCLRLLNNNSDNGFLLTNFTGVSFTNIFDLEPPVGNVGTITETGVITPVPAGTCCP